MLNLQGQHCVQKIAGLALLVIQIIVEVGLFMLKNISTLTLLIVLLLLSACRSSEQIKPIKEEYVGEGEKLKDWNREYIFVPNENGAWELRGFSGVMNFAGEEFSMHYLKLNM